MAQRKRVDGNPATSAGDRYSAEQEINEIRAELSRISTAGPGKNDVSHILSRLALLEHAVKERQNPGAHVRDAILEALSVAAAGKPGHMSEAELEAKLKISKSAVHHHTIELGKHGKIWIRKTWDEKTGRPGFRFYHPKAVRA